MSALDAIAEARDSDMISRVVIEQGGGRASNTVPRCAARFFQGSHRHCAVAMVGISLYL